MRKNTLLKSNEIGIFALGGLDEVGKNTYVFEIDNDIFVVDAGIMFPDHTLLGVDYVIPDYQYLALNQERIVGLFITHGHEDHIGGIPYLLKQVKIDNIYASGIAVDLIKSKLTEHQILNETKIIEYNNNSIFKFGKTEISFIRLNHSIPDMFGINFKTVHGNVFHTGDFKIDFTPVGPHAEFEKLTKIASEGVLCLLSDSTNAFVPGSTPSERIIGQSIDDAFRNIEGRIIISTFASNLYRIQQIVTASALNGRKLIPMGRSMEKTVEIGLANNYIQAPKDAVIQMSDMNSYDKDKITILSTGSQGEPFAALTRIASGTHATIKVTENDTVIFSSSPIPGNQESVEKIIDLLYKKNVKVIVNGPFSDTHASGHGSQNDLMMMLALTKPKYFIPVHGEHRMLKKHRELAINFGVKKENILILDNGEVAALTKNSSRIAGKVPANDVYIDGLGFGSTGSRIISERKLLSEDGLLALVLTVGDKQELIKKPTLVSRGFIFMKKSEDLINSIQEFTAKLYTELLKLNTPIDKIKSLIESDLQDFLKEATERKPVIITSVIQV